MPAPKVDIGAILKDDSSNEATPTAMPEASPVGSISATSHKELTKAEKIERTRKALYEQQARARDYDAPMNVPRGNTVQERSMASLRGDFVKEERPHMIKKKNALPPKKQVPLKDGKAHVSIRDAREGNQLIRKLTDLERTIIGIFESDASREDIKDDIYAVCRSYYLSQKGSKPTPVQKPVPAKESASKSQNPPAEKPQKAPHQKEDKKESVAPLTKKDMDTLAHVTPSPFGGAFQVELARKKDSRVINSAAAKSAHRSYIKTMIDKAGPGAKLVGRAEDLLRASHKDQKVLAKVRGVNFGTDKRVIGIWPSGLNDQKQEESLSKEDPIAEYVLSRGKKVSCSGNDLRSAYALIWYDLQPPEVRKSDVLEGAKTTKDLGTTSQAVSKSAAKLFEASFPYYREVMNRLAKRDGPYLTPQEAETVLADGHSPSEVIRNKQYHHINLDVARSYGRGNVMTTLLLYPNTNDLAGLDKAALIFRSTPEHEPEKRVIEITPDSLASYDDDEYDEMMEAVLDESEDEVSATSQIPEEDSDGAVIS